MAVVRARLVSASLPGNAYSGEYELLHHARFQHDNLMNCIVITLELAR